MVPIVWVNVMTRICRNFGTTVWALYPLGLYAIPGGEWNRKVYPGAAEWLKSWAKVPSGEWLELMKQWNPTKFDARKWAKMAKEMGVRYVKITTKHHEGFASPSKYTETQWPIPHTRKTFGGNGKGV